MTGVARSAPRRPRSADGPRTVRITFVVSAAEADELRRRAAGAGVSVARYVFAAALERPSTVSEQRMWAAEMARAERLIRSVAAEIEALVRQGRETGRVPPGSAVAIEAVTEAASAVVAMGKAAEG